MNILVIALSILFGLIFGVAIGAAVVWSMIHPQVTAFSRLANKYIDLITAFLCDEINRDEFRSRYLEIEL